MLVQFVIMGNRPSTAHFSDESFPDPIQLDIENGSLEFESGVYCARVEVRGILPGLLIDKLLHFRGFQVSVTSDPCFISMGGYPTTEVTLYLPRLELIQVQPLLVLARSELNEATNLDIEMTQSGYQAQERYYDRIASRGNGSQPRDREAIGNTQCKFNALSRHLRCAVRPEADTCSGCSDFEERV